MIFTAGRLPVIAGTVALTLFFGAMAFAQEGHGQQTILKIDLRTAINMALEQNSDLAIARLRKVGAEKIKNEATGNALPDLQLFGTYRYEGNVQQYEIAPGQKLQFQPDNNYLYGASFDQWIFSGSVFAGLRGVKHLVAAAEHNVLAARNSMLANVKINFYNVHYTKDLIRANEESVTQLTKHLEDSKVRKEVGLGTDYDIMRFETQLANVIPRLIEAKNNHDRAVISLLESLGLNPLRKVEIKGGLTFRPMSIKLEKAIDNAMAIRAELAAARENIALSREYTSAAKGDMWPTLKAFGRLTHANTNLTETGDFSWRREWNVGLKLEMNLFDGWERSSRVDQRKVDEQIAAIEKDKAIRSVLVEVKTAYDELLRARELVESQNKSISYAEESYRIINERRKEGMATQLELLDAQVTLTGTKINHSRSLFEYSLAKVRLERSMGMVNADE